MSAEYGKAEKSGVRVEAGAVTLRHWCEPGHRTLHLSSHRHLSRERSFDAVEGTVVRTWCRGALVWPMHVAALIKPDPSITLRPELSP